jgi:hypothetical protein
MEPPPLPAAVGRRLEILLEKLKEELGLDDAHLPRPDSPDRREESVRSRIVPTEDGPDFYDRLTGVRISKQREWRDFVERHRDDPETVDLIGLEPAIEFVVRAYHEIVGLYFEIWKKGPARYETFRKWLEPLEKWANREGRILWLGRRNPGDESDWFDRMVWPRAKDLIDDAADGWWRTARDFEEEHFEKSFGPVVTLSEPAGRHELAPEAPAAPATPGGSPLYGPRTLGEEKAERRKMIEEHRAECKRVGIDMNYAILAAAVNNRWRSRTQIEKWLACRYGGEYGAEVERQIRGYLTRETERLKAIPPNEPQA